MTSEMGGPAFPVQERARLLLRNLADGNGEVIPVCAEPAQPEDEAGGEWLASIFTVIDAELEDIPLPLEYPLWQPEALARWLAEIIWW